jgi:hypothetical protein
VGADMIQRCRVAANVDMPFACPDDCLFFEARSITDAGWRRFDDSDLGDEGGAPGS